MHGETMSLRLVPPRKKKSSRFEMISDSLSENAKIMILGFLLIFVPLVAYSIGEHFFDHTIGTHIGFFTGTACMLLATYLMYFSSWFAHLHNHTK